MACFSFISPQMENNLETVLFHWFIKHTHIFSPMQTAIVESLHLLNKPLWRSHCAFIVGNIAPLHWLLLHTHSSIRPRGLIGVVGGLVHPQVSVSALGWTLNIAFKAVESFCCLYLLNSTGVKLLTLMWLLFIIMNSVFETDMTNWPSFSCI